MTELFEAINSPTTKRKYELRIRQFLAWVYGDKKLGTPNRQGKLLSKQEEEKKNELTKRYAKGFVARARAEPEWASAAISDFLGEVKARVQGSKGEKIEPSTVGIYAKPLKLFCTMNDITVNWAKLSRKIPKGRQAADDRPPTLEEVKKILQYPDRRIKPIVLVMISSGIRVGSWDRLRWGHIEKIEKDSRLIAARLKAYNTKANRWYRTFITPEAYKAVEEYLNYRQSMGEMITSDAPIIRDLLDTDKGGFGRPSKPSPLSSKIVKRLIELAIKGAGIRIPLEPGHRRHPFKATHGFRKYFDTVAERYMKTLHVEQLLDHDTGLKESYNRPTEDDLLSEYMKAVPELTILERIQAAPSEEVDELKREFSQLQSSHAALLQRVARWEAFNKKFMGMSNDELTELGNQAAQAREEKEHEERDS